MFTLWSGMRQWYIKNMGPRPPAGSRGLRGDRSRWFHAWRQGIVSKENGVSDSAGSPKGAVHAFTASPTAGNGERRDPRGLLPVLIEALAQPTAGCLYLVELDPTRGPRIVWQKGTCGRDIAWGTSHHNGTSEWRDVVLEEDRPRIDAHWEALLRGEISSCAFRVRTPDGSVHWLRNDGWPQRESPDQTVVRVYGVARDITLARRALEEARASAAGCQELFATIDEGVWRFRHDREGNYHVVDLNPAAERMEKVTREQAIGRTLESALPDRAEELAKVFREVETTQVPHYLPASYYTNSRVSGWRDGKVYHLPSRQIMLVYRDITERVMAEQELSELEERLAIACQGQSLGKLAGAVAHDFNNKLAPILGYTQLLQEELGRSHPLYDDLVEVEAAAVQAKDLARQLLDFSRRQLLDLRRMDLSRTVREWKKMITRLLREDVELVVDAGPPAWIRADATRIRQLLLDFAVTANHALARGGTLCLAIDVVRQDTGQERGHGQCDVVRLRARFAGSEIHHEHLALEPFRTGRPGGPAMLPVLNLGAIQEIIRQHEGQMFKSFSSATEVVFEIRLVAEKPAPATSQPDILGPGVRRCETILLIEDATPVRDMAKRILEMAGYVVVDAPDAETAIEIAEEYEGSPIHLLLADVVLPLGDGKSLGDRLQALRPGLKILYTSGHPREMLDRLGIVEHEVNFLPKPFSAKGLLRAVRRALEE